MTLKHLIPGGAPDQEIADLMEELGKMKTWAVILCSHQVNGARHALDVIDRTRELIVSRMYPNAVNPRPFIEYQSDD